jgi:RHS repeat-associated protein
VAADGSPNASFVYTPFGSVAESTDGGGAFNGVAAHDRRQNDKYVDALSRLAYYGARYYDGTLIGWTNADPLYLHVPDAGQTSSPRRANLYSFSLQNPLRYTDPDGMDPASLGSYKSEMELSNQHRGTLEAESHWQLRFSQTGSPVGQLSMSDMDCPGGLSRMGAGICGLGGDGDTEDVPEAWKKTAEIIEDPGLINRALNSAWETTMEPIPFNPVGNIIIKDTSAVVGPALKGDFTPAIKEALWAAATWGAGKVIRAAGRFLRAEGRVAKTATAVGKKWRGRKAPPSEVCHTCGGDGGMFAHPEGYLSPRGGPEPICEDCYFKVTNGRRPTGSDAIVK